MKNLVLLLGIVLTAAVSRASGCDSEYIYAMKNAFVGATADEDFQEIPLKQIQALAQEYQKQYGDNLHWWLKNKEIEIPIKQPASDDPYFNVRSQWVTYNNLTTDCNWDISNYVISFKQLVIQLSDNQYMVFPNYTDLSGELIKSGPYLTMTPKK